LFESLYTSTLLLQEVDSSYDGPDSDASSEEFFDPANQGQQGLGKDGNVHVTPMYISI